MENKEMTLGDRMKEYENVNRTYLERKVPVIMRIDGKAFHTYTKGFEKPFDQNITDAMILTMEYLCKNIQGCMIGYTQSDEITLVLTDYINPKTDAWFQYNTQKMCSVASSMATMYFNKMIKYLLELSDNEQEEKNKKLLQKDALFDARCWNLPLEEVNNCLIWRQRDAIRNSIQGYAYSFFSHKEIYKLNTSQLIEKVLLEKGVSWHDLPLNLQRGTAFVKTQIDDRWEWVLYKDEIPLFTENPDFVENRIYIGDHSK